MSGSMENAPLFLDDAVLYTERAAEVLVETQDEDGRRGEV